MHIAARTERATRTRDYNSAHLSFIAQSCERIRQLSINLERQRVQSFGAMQSYPAHTVANFVNETLGLKHKSRDR